MIKFEIERLMDHIIKKKEKQATEIDFPKIN